MTNEEFNRFLAQVKRTRLVDYLSPMQWETAEEALDSRISWAEEHLDDPEYAAEASFLLEHREALALRLRADEQVEADEEWVESETAESSGGVHSWVKDVDEKDDSLITKMSEKVRRAVDEAEADDPSKRRWIRVATPTPASQRREIHPDFLPTNITRIEDLTNPPLEFRQGATPSPADLAPGLSEELQRAIFERNAPESELHKGAQTLIPDLDEDVDLDTSEDESVTFRDGSPLASRGPRSTNQTIVPDFDEEDDDQEATVVMDVNPALGHAVAAVIAEEERAAEAARSAGTEKKASALSPKATYKPGGVAPPPSGRSLGAAGSAGSDGASPWGGLAVGAVAGVLLLGAAGLVVALVALPRLVEPASTTPGEPSAEGPAPAPDEALPTRAPVKPSPSGAKAATGSVPAPRGEAKPAASDPAPRSRPPTASPSLTPGSVPKPEATAAAPVAQPVPAAKPVPEATAATAAPEPKPEPVLAAKPAPEATAAPTPPEPASLAPAAASAPKPAPAPAVVVPVAEPETTATAPLPTPEPVAAASPAPEPLPETTAVTPSPKPEPAPVTTAAAPLPETEPVPAAAPVPTPDPETTPRAPAPTPVPETAAAVDDPEPSPSPVGTTAPAPLATTSAPTTTPPAEEPTLAPTPASPGEEPPMAPTPASSVEELAATAAAVAEDPKPVPSPIDATPPAPETAPPVPSTGSASPSAPDASALLDPSGGEAAPPIEETATTLGNPVVPEEAGPEGAAPADGAPPPQSASGTWTATTTAGTYTLVIAPHTSGAVMGVLQVPGRAESITLAGSYAAKTGQLTLIGSGSSLSGEVGATLAKTTLKLGADSTSLQLTRSAP